MGAYFGKSAVKYVLIGCGGFLGAIARYLVKGMQIQHYQGNLPINTLLVNIVGTFLLALVITITLEIKSIDPGIKLGITAGLLGAFTTFSTVSRETAFLIYSGDWFTAISYIGISAVFGISAAWVGMITAGIVSGRIAGTSRTGAVKARLEVNGTAAEGEAD